MSLSFLFGVGVFLLPFLGNVMISCSISSRSTSSSTNYNDNNYFALMIIDKKNKLIQTRIPHVHVVYYDAQLCISVETK